MQEINIIENAFMGETKMKENIEEICLNIILGNNKIVPRPYDVGYKYCYGCTRDIKNELCSHYTPIRMWIIEIKEK